MLTSMHACVPQTANKPRRRASGLQSLVTKLLNKPHTWKHPRRKIVQLRPSLEPKLETFPKIHSIISIVSQHPFNSN
jgi:hypothetical protein